VTLLSAEKNCHYHGAAPFTTQRERIEDALREIGTLLMTFAPLDAAINPGESGARLLIFFFIGLIVFVLALRLERSRFRETK
jgi:hypothetical protein